MLQHAHEQRLYKQITGNGDILSPVDSGIGAEILDHAKNDFFGGSTIVSVVQQAQHQQHQASVIAHAQQDPEIMQHVAAVIDRRDTGGGSVREASIPLVIPKVN
jgi:hypothetical protein